MSFKEVIDKSPIIFFIGTLITGALALLTIFQIFGYKVLSPADIADMKFPEVLEFSGQEMVSYELPSSGFDSTIILNAFFEANVLDGSNLKSEKIEDRARFTGKIIVNQKMCAEAQVYHNSADTFVIEGKASCRIFQGAEQTLFIQALRTEAVLEAAKKVQLKITRVVN